LFLRNNIMTMQRGAIPDHTMCAEFQHYASTS
jgi:hypothetical protein